MGAGQNLERPNVKRLIFRNFEISNMKIMKDEFFFLFSYLFLFSFVSVIRTPKTYNDWSFEFSKL